MINDLLSKNPEQVNSKIENILEQNLLNICEGKHGSYTQKCYIVVA